MKRAPARSGGDDKKLQQTLKKLNVQPIQAIEEVNMFKSDGNVIHFAAPKGEMNPYLITAVARPTFWLRPKTVCVVAYKS